MSNNGKKQWTMESFIEAFVIGTLGKKTKHSTMFVTFEPCGQVLRAITFGEKDIAAIRLHSGVTIGNASRFNGIGGRMAWGNFHRAWGQTDVQRLLEKHGAAMLPFSVVEQLKLDITKIGIIDRKQSEDVLRPIPTRSWELPNLDEESQKICDAPTTSDAYRLELEHSPRKDSDGVEYRYINGGWNKMTTVHFIGAILFQVEDAFFLFDIDREEVKHGMFNPFVVKLPHAAKTIDEAYESLIPQEVKQANLDGLDVVRQGEWFFVPSTFVPQTKDASTHPVAFRNPPMPERGLIDALLRDGRKCIPGDRVAEWRFKDGSEERKMADTYNALADAWRENCESQFDFHSGNPEAGQLRQGNNRPNRVEQYVKQDGFVFVKGKVTHEGREHREVMLDTWHRAIPNTAVGSWQVSGDVD